MSRVLESVEVKVCRSCGQAGLPEGFVYGARSRGLCIPCRRAQMRDRARQRSAESRGEPAPDYREFGRSWLVKGEVPLGWRLQARCADPGVDPNIFFVMDPPNDNVDWDKEILRRASRTPRRSALTTEAQRLLTEAKEICASCPVREACLEYAMARKEPFGIYGGLTAHERHLLRRDRARNQAHLFGDDAA